MAQVQPQLVAVGAQPVGRTAGGQPLAAAVQRDAQMVLGLGLVGIGPEQQRDTLARHRRAVHRQASQQQAGRARGQGVALAAGTQVRRGQQVQRGIDVARGMVHGRAL